MVGSGFSLRQGDRVRTGKNSWAVIKLLCGSAPRGWIRLEPETEFLFAATSFTASQVAFESHESYKSQVTLRMRLLLGRIYIKILRPFAPTLSPAIEFEVVTDAATVGVRGTLFSVCVSPSGITGVSVREGLVEVAAQGKSIFLKPGQATIVRPGMPPELPGLMSPEERKQWQGPEKWLEEIEDECATIEGEIEWPVLFPGGKPNENGNPQDGNAGLEAGKGVEQSQSKEGIKEQANKVNGQINKVGDKDLMSKMGAETP